ncbi:hypothetical protein [Candidatus Vidania fulgoroideorum]
MKKKIYKIISKIFKKKFNFNESIDVFFNLKLKNDFLIKCNIIFPNKIKKRKVISFVNKENIEISKKILEKNNTFDLKKLKSFNLFFFDIESYFFLKKKIYFLIKKKKKIDFSYGNITNDLNVLKLISIGKMYIFDLKKTTNIVIGTINMRKSKIFENFIFFYNYILNILFSKNYNKKNILSIFFKSTQGIVYKL